MNIIAIVLAFILYMVICVGNVRQRDYPMALVWFSYSLSQVGFLLYEINKASSAD
jgi:hypothetical protein